MNVLISGGSRGIGRACVERFAREGHKVTFLYFSNDTAANEVCRLTRANAIRCDVSSSEQVKESVRRAIEDMGSIDVLINNAGISELCFFDSITDGQWQRMIDTNLGGAFYLCREVSRHMICAKHGKIINIGSMWGKVGASCEVHYSAAKAGLRGLTVALAKELGPSGINVNCIEPGVIDTEMNAHLDETAMRELADDTPLMRIGKPAEVAALAAFLASDDAAFITGQTIGIDGGFAI